VLFLPVGIVFGKPAQKLLDAESLEHLGMYLCSTS
jgi:hypothetical protein